MLSGQQHAPDRGTDRRAGIVVGEFHARLAKLNQIGCFYFSLAIRLDLSISQVICININDVGFGRGRLAEAGIVKNCYKAYQSSCSKNE